MTDFDAEDEVLLAELRRIAKLADPVPPRRPPYPTPSAPLPRPRPSGPARPLPPRSSPRAAARPDPPCPGQRPT